MKYFLDTEFADNGKHGIDVISVGLVCEDGNEVYLVSNEFSLSVPKHMWLAEHVMPHVDEESDERISNDDIASYLEGFVDSNPTFYGYFSAYDWVVVCQLFGGMLNLPASWPKFCYDIKQMSMLADNLRFDPPTYEPLHHALGDARWVKEQYFKYLEGFERKNRGIPNAS